MTDNLSGITVRESPCMTGSKLAIEHKGIYRVSPAMYLLMSREDSDGLKHLLGNIRVLHLPDYSLSLGMTTELT